MNDLLYMEINLKAIKANIQSIVAQTKKNIIPVIKSNAYGLGDIEIMSLIDELNLDYAAVVDMSEAKRLLDYNPNFRILILNSLQKEDIPYLIKYPSLTITINEIKDIRLLNEVSLQRKIKVHLQIDTGMNRLGLKDESEYLKTLELIKSNPNIEIEGIYTHFTGPENRINQEQKFVNFVKAYPYQIIHVAASSTCRLSSVGNYVRVGMDIYGSGEKKDVKQAIKVACRPLKIQSIKAGETIGYDQEFLATKDMLVAVLPIGYRNGFRRSLHGFPVLVNGKRYSTIGIVCMNHLFVKVDEDVNLDSEFIITSSELPVSEIAEYLGTVPHEVLCMLRIEKKVYIK